MYCYANAPQNELFYGVDGQKINVCTNLSNNIHYNGSNIENNSVVVGDVIKSDKAEEIVIGVSKSGRYITKPIE